MYIHTHIYLTNKPSINEINNIRLGKHLPLTKISWNMRLHTDFELFWSEFFSLFLLFLLPLLLTSFAGGRSIFLCVFVFSLVCFQFGIIFFETIGCHGS